MAHGVDDSQGVTLEQKIQWFTESEERTEDARELSEKDRDYYDGKQWTSAETAEMNKRKQPVIVINRTKRKVDFLTGSEIQTRTDPKAFPRTPKHQEAAEAATDAIRFVADNNQYEAIRSDVWENLVIEGAGGAAVREKRKGGESEIIIEQIAWDRIFYDPHSSKRNFSDAKYKGIVLWMDLDDAIDRWPGSKGILETMLAQTSTADTYDDKPKFTVWADARRNRVRVVEIHYHRKGEWRFCIFTNGGELTPDQPSRYLDEDGIPECPLHLASAFVDRDNNRYGAVRELIGPQDEVNKRRSKALHLLTMRQTKGDKGAVEDIRKMKQELARPDGHVEVNPNQNFEVLNTNDMTAGHLALLQEAKQEIDGMGPNASLQGKQEQQLSGRALLAQQQGGFVELGRLIDSRRQFDLGVYRSVWNRIKQFWNAEKWIRVTDDEENLKFVGLNRPVTVGEMFEKRLEEQGVPPEQIQAELARASRDPRFNRVAKIENQVAEMDVDIIVEQSPDTVTIQAEQFDQLVKLPQAGIPLPPDLIIEASSLRNKKQIIERLKGGDDPERAKQQQAAQQLLIKEKVTDISKTQSEAVKNIASADKIQAETAAIAAE